MTSVSVTSSLSPAAARALTDEVKRDAEALWGKLLDLYEGGAHLALGYRSWGDYFETEFGQSRTRGYEILAAGRVVESVRHGGLEPPTNERQARELVPLLDRPDDLREAWADANWQTNGAPTAATVRDVVRERLPGPKTAARIARETGVAQPSSDGFIHLPGGQAPTDYMVIHDCAEWLARVPPPSELYVPDTGRATVLAALDAIESFISRMRERFP